MIVSIVCLLVSIVNTVLIHLHYSSANLAAPTLLGNWLGLATRTQEYSRVEKRFDVRHGKESCSLQPQIQFGLKWCVAPSHLWVDISHKLILWWYLSNNLTASSCPLRISSDLVSPCFRPNFLPYPLPLRTHATKVVTSTHAPFHLLRVTMQCKWNTQLHTERPPDNLGGPVPIYTASR